MDFKLRLSQLNGWLVKNRQEKTFAMLSQLGDLRQVIEEINRMPILIPEHPVASEIRLDSKYFVACHEKTVFAAKTSDLLHIFCSQDVDGTNHLYWFGVVTRTGSHYFRVIPNHVQTLWDLLSEYCRTFDQWDAQNRTHTYQYNPDIYTFSPDYIIMHHARLIRQDTEVRLRTQDVVWCLQTFQSDSEGCDTYWLNLLMVDGTSHKIRTLGEFDAYKCALMIRDNNPYVLYGPNPQWAELYRKNPRLLQEHARSIRRR